MVLDFEKFVMAAGDPRVDDDDTDEEQMEDGALSAAATRVVQSSLHATKHMQL